MKWEAKFHTWRERLILVAFCSLASLFVLQGGASPLTSALVGAVPCAAALFLRWFFPIVLVANDEGISYRSLFYKVKMNKESIRGASISSHCWTILLEPMGHVDIPFHPALAGFTDWLRKAGYMRHKTLGVFLILCSVVNIGCSGERKAEHTRAVSLVIDRKVQGASDSDAPSENLGSNLSVSVDASGDAIHVAIRNQSSRPIRVLTPLWSYTVRVRLFDREGRELVLHSRIATTLPKLDIRAATTLVPPGGMINGDISKDSIVARYSDISSCAYCVVGYTGESPTANESINGYLKDSRKPTWSKAAECALPREALIEEK